MSLRRRELLMRMPGVMALFAAGDLVSACGGAPAVNAVANDFSFQFSRLTVPAGKVHFTLKNNSKTYNHELWVYPQNQPKLKDMLAAKDASTNGGSDVDEADYLQGVAGKVEDLEPGKTASFDATLAAGAYEMACFVVTTMVGKPMVHYEMGMHAILTVQ